MSNDRLWAGMMLAVCFFAVETPELRAQSDYLPYANWGDPNWGDANNALRANRGDFFFPRVDPPTFRTPVMRDPVSADVLRHPMSRGVARQLDQAMALANKSKHIEAIASLEQTLTKYPTAAPYVHNLLGLEFVAMGRHEAASKEFEQVIAAMPHLSENYTNYALARAILGDLDGAERALRRALDLDATGKPANELAEIIQQAKAGKVRLVSSTATTSR